MLGLEGILSSSCALWTHAAVRMKLLVVEFNSAIAGAEHSLLELLDGLDAEHEITLACPAGPLADRAALLGIRTARIPGSQLTFRIHPKTTPLALAATARASAHLAAIARSVRPEVTHANSIRGGLIAIPAVRGISPVVVHCRDALPPTKAGSLVRIALRGADRLVATSAYVAANIAGARWTERRVTVVDNAVDVARFDPATLATSAARSGLSIEHPLVLSVIGQLSPRKGQDLAIRTLAELRRRGLPALLLVAGKAKFVGPSTREDNCAYETELHRLVAAYGLEDHVRFLGERSDPELILAASDVLLVPSTVEPFGRTIIEAMAMGVPVAATGCGGPPEILAGGVGGTTVHTRRPADWADAVEELGTWPAARRAASRPLAQTRFSRERHASAMMSVYAAARRGGARDARRLRRARQGPSPSSVRPRR
jgi:L-malate glycosyltransferase